MGSERSTLKLCGVHIWEQLSFGLITSFGLIMAV